MVIISEGEYLAKYQRLIYVGLESRWQINSQPWLQEQISGAHHSAVDLFISFIYSIMICLQMALLLKNLLSIDRMMSELQVKE